MDDIFTTHSVYKTLIVCETDEGARTLLQQLIDEDHSVSYILPAEDDDPERPSCTQRFRQFATGSSRVLMMSYATWYKMVDRVEEYAMDHNLLILHGLDTPEQNIFMSWIMDARDRGFLPLSENYHILIQPTFSVPHE